MLKLRRPNVSIKKTRSFLSKNIVQVAVLISGGVLVVGGVVFYRIGSLAGQDYPQDYNKGLAAYEQERPEDANYWFERVAGGFDENEFREAALYNIGTMLGERAFNVKLSLQDRFNAAQKAIDKLREAVGIDPNDENAKWNLELLLVEQGNIAQGMMASGSGPDPGEPDSDQQQPGYSPGDGNKGF